MNDEVASAAVTGPGDEFVSFTPITEESKAANEVVQANMMKYAQEHGISF